MELKNKVAIITGASKGIGKAIALNFAKQGCKLVLVGRSESSLAGVAKDCESLGAEALSIPFDLTNLQDIPLLLDKTLDRFGKLNIIVNNAGASANNNPYECDLAEWDKTLTLNVQAPYHLTNLALHKISPDEEGAIVFISSIAAKMTYKNGGIYCLSKHALTAYANCLYDSVRDKNILVTTLHPGYVNTDLGVEDNLIPEKMIQVEEIAETVSALLKLPERGCPTEIKIRPRTSPYK